MIVKEQEKQALQALNAILIVARKMAYGEEPHERIAAVLDRTEHLPLLIVSREDRTKEFRAQLEELTNYEPLMRLALERFDSKEPFLV